MDAQADVLYKDYTNVLLSIIQQSVKKYVEMEFIKVVYPLYNIVMMEI